jgi:cation transporter-like permease
MFAAIPLALVIFPLAVEASALVSQHFNLSGRMQDLSHSLIVGLSAAIVVTFAFRGLVFRRWQQGGTP